MSDNKPLIQVAAAIIWNEKSEILVCQRPAGKNLPLKWEFPGGKIEESETFKDTCIRECLEELDLKIIIDNEYIDVTHNYEAFSVHIKFFNAHIDKNYKNTSPKKLEHNEILWTNIYELEKLDFCPADSDVIKKIVADNS